MAFEMAFQVVEIQCQCLFILYVDLMLKKKKKRIKGGIDLLKFWCFSLSKKKQLFIGKSCVCQHEFFFLFLEKHITYTQKKMKEVFFKQKIFFYSLTSKWSSKLDWDFTLICGKLVELHELSTLKFQCHVDRGDAIIIPAFRERSKKNKKLTNSVNRCFFSFEC